MEKRFRALRFIGTLLKVLAWIFLVGAIVVALVSVIGGIAGSSQLTSAVPIDAALAGIVMGLGALIGGLIYFVAFYASAEFIYVLLAIEENTRLTAMALSGRASG